MVPTRDWIMRCLSGAALLAIAMTEPARGQSANPVEYAEKILSNRPLPATDRTLFDFYQRFPYALHPEPTEEQAFALLGQYLQVQYGQYRSGIVRGMNLFVAEEARRKVPSPSLRAAFVALQGTFAWPAHHFVLNATTSEGLPKVKEIRFDDLLGPQLAVVRVDEQTHQMSILFSSEYKGENPFLFTSTMASLLLHQDLLIADVGRLQTDYETLIVVALRDLIFLDQLARHPELALSRTWLSTRLNEGAAARLNSGLGSRLGLYATNDNAHVLPHNPGRGRNWLGNSSIAPTTTPGNQLLTWYLQQLDARRVPLPNPDFSKETLDWIDQNQAAIIPQGLVWAAMALRLDITHVRQ